MIAGSPVGFLSSVSQYTSQGFSTFRKFETSTVRRLLHILDFKISPGLLLLLVERVAQEEPHFCCALFHAKGVGLFNKKDRSDRNQSSFDLPVHKDAGNSLPPARLFPHHRCCFPHGIYPSSPTYASPLRNRRRRLSGQLCIPNTIS